MKQLEEVQFLSNDDAAMLVAFEASYCWPV